MESVWDKGKKWSRIQVVRHLGCVIDEALPARSTFDSIGKLFSLGALAIYWSISEEFSIMDILSGIVGKDSAYSILILALFVKMIMNPSFLCLYPGKPGLPVYLYRCLL